MPTFRNPFTRKDPTRGSTPVDGRLAMAGLVTPAGDVAVTPGVISGLTVSGRSTAPVWAYSVAGGHAVTTRGATDGASLTGLDGATDTPTVSAAPATGSRWDLVWIRQRDVDNGDPDSDAALGVTSGTASGSPSKPYGSVPAGALVLAEAQVSAGASATSDALVTITQVAARVAARGGIVPAGTTARRDLLAAGASTSSPVYADVAGAIYRGDGVAWQAVYLPPLDATFALDTGLWNAGTAATLTRRGLYWSLTVGFVQKATGTISGGWTTAGTVPAEARVAAGGIFGGAAVIYAPSGASASRINRATGLVEFISPGFGGTGGGTSYNIALSWPAV